MCAIGLLALGSSSSHSDFGRRGPSSLVETLVHSPSANSLRVDFIGPPYCCLGFRKGTRIWVWCHQSDSVQSGRDFSPKQRRLFSVAEHFDRRQLQDVAIILAEQDDFARYSCWRIVS